MMYFNRAAICLAVLLGMPCRNVFPQTPFNYDTLKISLGYVISDYRKTLAKDTTDSDFLILCPAIYKSDIDQNNIDIYSHLTTAPQPGEFFVGQLPNQFIDSCFIDKPGDTLVLLGSFGKNKAVISEIAYLEQGDNTRIYCLLGLVEPISPLAKMGPFVAVRPEGRRGIYAFTFNTIPVNRKSNTFIDSVKTLHLKSWIEIRGHTMGKKAVDEILNHPLDSNYCEITIYKKQPNPLSTLTDIQILANLGPKIPDIRSSVYQIDHIVPEDLSISGWNIKPLLDVSSYGKIKELVCTFDLNDDGKKEYLVIEQEEELRSIIYSDSDSGWVPVASGDATWEE